MMTQQEAFELVERQARAWEAADADAALADFAAECMFISPGGRWQGHAAIRQAMYTFFQGVNAVQVTITRVLISGDQGAAEWTW